MKRTLLAIVTSIGLTSLVGAAAFADEKPAGDAKPAETTPAVPAKAAHKHGKKVKTDDKKPEDKKVEGKKMEGKGRRSHRRVKGAATTPAMPAPAVTPVAK